MEEFVVLILQVVVEVGMQILGSIGFDFLSNRSSKNEVGCGWLVLFAVFGAGLGGISLLILPTLLLPTLTLRIANLVLAPLVAGALSYLVARTGVLNGPPSIHFWRGCWFALAFGLVRFIGAGR